ncbi:MAG: 50S ribosomal protein L22 [Candidatus Moeniiplasma glomeromycotorum]|nr:50S ribosomal protein L22 [Candidatus Moeniiplasma glomeromycotorum]MCE8167140.1 50S ribosomal protein L22 [Candidatus Moeniiplasma glomeromycotorum]MCE8168848.1 50S ribosomal protein L22 [Candidatus Moeniiplasma glomeromycotorum]
MTTNNLVSKKETLNTPSTITLKSPPLLISPQKMRLVGKLIRHQNLDYLLATLPFLPFKGARLVLELFQKEVKYWEKKGLSPSDFYVHKTQINQGSTRKKIIFRAKGRADRIRRRSSLVEIYLSKKNKY